MFSVILRGKKWCRSVFCSATPLLCFWEINLFKENDLFVKDYLGYFSERRSFERTTRSSSWPGLPFFLLLTLVLYSSVLFFFLQIKIFKLKIFIQTDTSFSTAREKLSSAGVCRVLWKTCYSLHSIMMPNVTVPFLQVFFHPYTAKHERNLYVLLAIIIPKIFVTEMEIKLVVTLFFFLSANYEGFFSLLYFYIPAGHNNFVLCCFPGLALG